MHNPSDRLVSVRGPHRQRPGKLFRRFRRTVRVVFIVLLIIPVLAVILTQGPVAQWLLARAVRNATGGDFSSSWVSLKLDGRLVISDVHLKARGIKGEAANVVDAREVEVLLDWSAWAAGVVEARAVRIDKPILRVSLDSHDNTLNLSSLGGKAAAGGLPVLPRIEVAAGTVILGEHDEKGAFTPLTTFRTRGWISPVFQSDRSLIQLQAENPADSSMDFSLAGQMNLATSEGEVTVSGIELSRWNPEKLPSGVRPLWEQLRLRGRIASTDVRFTRAAGIEATLHLQDVALRAPFASGRAEITGSRNPLMENVSGYMRFTTGGPGKGLQAGLTGLFEDLPAQVRFESQGLTIDAPYRAVVIADRFLLEKDPRILWFTPEVVQQNFERFSGPTAVIDARIEVARAGPETPGTPGETSISGTMIFRNADAAYEIFPYPLHDLSGTIRFDDDKVEIVGVQGRGPTGARIFAEGRLEPPSGGSSLDVVVAATDLPMDDYLWSTLEKTQGKSIMDAVFSSKRLQELRDKGLIAPRGSPGDERTPAFDFGGLIDSVVVHVTSPFGPGQPLHQAVDVRFEQASLLPDVFPYPLKGRNVAVRLGDDFCEVVGNDFTGIRGGQAALTARVDFHDGPDGNTVYEPTIHVTTTQFPVDALLINAIPDQSAGDDPARTLSVKGLLLQLNVGGLINGDISLTPNRVAGGAPIVSADLTLDHLSARPAHPPDAPGAALVMSDVSGGLNITGDAITIRSLTGAVAPVGGAPPAQPSTFVLDGRWTAASGAPPAPAAPRDPLSLNLTATLADLDLSLALEDILRPIAPDAAAAVAQVRAERRPSGAVNMAIAVTQPTGGALAVDAAITGARSLAADVDGRRITLNQHEGLVRAVATLGGDAATRQPMRFTFKGFRADLGLDGEPVASVTINGSVSPPQADPPLPLAVYEPLLAELRGLRLQSPFAREVMGRFGGPAMVKQLADLDPAGVVDSEVRLTPTAGQDDPAKWDMWAAIRPEWLAFNKGPGGARITFPLISGQITVEDDKGSIQELTIIDEPGGWNARLNGQWTGASENRPWVVQLTAALEGESFAPNLLALLPDAISQAIADAHAQVYGGLDAPDIRVTLRGAPPDEAGAAADMSSQPAAAMAYDVTGVLNLHALYAQPGGSGEGDGGGLSVRNGEVSINVDAHKPSDGPARITLGLNSPHVRLAGLKITDAAGTVIIAEEPATGATIITLPALTGRAYGGRLSITGAAASPAAPPGSDSTSADPIAYHATVQLGGVRFADIVADQKRQHSSEVGPPVPEELIRPEAGDPTPDYRRGMVEGELSLSGVMGPKGTRHGRGAVRIAGGKAVVNMPIIFNVLQIANLQLPTGEQFDFAHADFFLTGDAVTLEHAVLLSNPLAMVGSGTMNLDSGGLDLRFVSRSRRRLPMLSDLIEAVRNGVLSVRVSGTLSDPAYNVEPLLTFRRLLAGRISELQEAERVDLDGLERDRQRTLGIIAEVKQPVPP